MRAIFWKRGLGANVGIRDGQSTFIHKVGNIFHIGF
jgi:hypothetical protein